MKTRITPSVQPYVLGRRPFLSLAVALATVQRVARADALTDTLASIARARAGLKSLTGPFTQERTIGLLASKVVSKGILHLLPPDRMRWELLPPDSVTYWVTPSGLAFKGQSSKGKVPMTDKMAQELQDLRAIMSGDIGVLRERYDLSLVPGGDGASFEALPKPGQTARFQKLAFSLDADLVRPRKATLVEDTKNRTEITFGELQKNVTIDAAVFVPQV